MRIDILSIFAKKIENMKEIKLDDILIKMVEKGKPFYNEEDIKNAMREACKQTLELAAEEIEISIYDLEYGFENEQMRADVLDLINKIK